MKKKILVVGDLILDEYIFGDVTKISQEAPIPIINIRKNPNNRIVLGGAANVAANIKTLGCDVKLVGLVGNCVNSREIKKLLKIKKIKNNLLKLNKYYLTKKTRILSNQNQIVRLDNDSAEIYHDQQKLNKILIKEIKGINILIISDYNKGTIKNLNQIISIANKKKIKVLIDSKKKDLREFQNSYLIKPNEKEFREIFSIDLSGKNSNSKIIKKLKENRIKNLLLTLGKKGMKHYSYESVKNFKSQTKDVFDVTGAGDTVIAALGVGIEDNKDLHSAIKFALNAAEITIGKVGTSVVYKDEIDNCYQTEKKKIYSINEINKILEISNKLNKSIVFTNGCFDLFHPGHLKILKESKKKGDILVVGLNSDKSVKLNKGSSRPIINQIDRANILAAINYVDYIILFNEKTPYKLINKLRPDIITKGSDYKDKKIIGSNLIKKNGGKVVIIEKYKDYSTSKIVD